MDPAEARVVACSGARLDLGEQEADALAAAVRHEERAARAAGAAADLLGEHLAQVGRRRVCRREAAVMLDQIEPEAEDRLVVVRARGPHDERGGNATYFTTLRSLARIMRRLPDFEPSDHVPVSSSGDG